MIIFRVFKIGLAIRAGVSLHLNTGNADPLTPPNQPVDDSFFVCYQYRSPHLKSCRILRYFRYKYRGCIISKIPCNAIPLPKICAPKEILIKKTATVVTAPVCCVATYKLFYWYDNYPQALNAFYRCAYSG